MTTILLIINSIMLLIELIKKLNLQGKFNSVIDILRNIDISNCEVENRLVIAKAKLLQEEKFEETKRIVLLKGKKVEEPLFKRVLKYLPDVRISYTFKF